MKINITIGGMVLLFLFGMSLLVTQPAFAADTKGGVTKTTSNTTNTVTAIENPIRAKNLQCLVLGLFQMAVNVLAFVAVGYIIWAGFLFVKAQGNDSELTKAKTALRNAIIGSFLVFGAWVFAEIISRTITNIAGGTPVQLDADQC